jgi:EmrB/QacA subfamily drug resistance transporter
MTLVHSPCDATIARNQDASARVSHPGLVIATTILASSMALVDGSVVNVALPTIGASLGADAVGLQWVVNAYLLPLSALLLLGGAAGDRFGSRRLLMIGVGLFGAASIACAMAPSLAWLLAARFVQGAGAALLMPGSLAILGQSFSGEAKGRAIGIWAAAGTAGAALGPVLGGWLIDAGSWRLIFLINVPLAAAAITLAYFYVSADADEGSHPLDVTGAVLATAGLGLATWALTEASGRGWSMSALVALCAGCLLLVGFVLAERHRGDKAMMPLTLFASPSFVGLTLLTFLLYGALGGLFVLLPYILIEAAGYTATQAGAALLPLPLVITLASPAAGALAGKIGPRWLLVIGPIIVAAGFLLALRIGSGTSYWSGVLPAMLVIAMGMAGAVAPLTTAVLMSVDDHHVGAASGLNSAVARTGGLVATALIGSVLAAVGPALVSAFGIAAAIGAALCLGASLSAWLFLPR